jgi:hypothetical protein
MMLAPRRATFNSIGGHLREINWPFRLQALGFPYTSANCQRYIHLVHAPLRCALRQGKENGYFIIPVRHL